MLNAPCINRNCLFPNDVLVENIKQVLTKHGCKKIIGKRILITI